MIVERKRARYPHSFGVCHDLGDAGVVVEVVLNSPQEADDGAMVGGGAKLRRQLSGGLCGGAGSALWRHTHLSAIALSVELDLGQLWRIAGSKSAPFGQPSVWTSGSIRTWSKSDGSSKGAI